MPSHDEDEYKSVIFSLSMLIQSFLNRGAHQQYEPDASPDLSDHKTADALVRAARLRRLRDEFEEVMSGALMEKFRDPNAKVPADPRL